MNLTIYSSLQEMTGRLDGALKIRDDGVDVLDPNVIRAELIDELVSTAVFGEGDVRDAARWVIRVIAPEMGAWPASIQDLYMASARGEYHNITTPAINLRMLTYDMAQRVFRAAKATETKQILLELARSEMGYTDQRPAEYASSVLGAAIREGWNGPVMIQGDHYQANAKAYAKDPDAEIGAVRDLAIEALKAGYGNIDIDSSTLVDLSYERLIDQQKLNSRHTAELTKAIRDHEPDGWTISIGGEIGEVGKENSTVEDLDAFMEGYEAELDRIGNEIGGDIEDITGISKISVQTGTSHGGIVLPDGSIKEVSVDFETLAKLSEAAKRYGMGGAVQHGASTLPESAFHKFAEADAVEVHLATAFQNAIFDSAAFPDDLKREMYAWLDVNRASERKDGQTDEQFYYTTRKRASGPFKRNLWELPDEVRDEMLGDLQPKFELIMQKLNVAGNGELVDRYVTRMDVDVPAPDAVRTFVKAG
ncbi:MAG TPA: class II fructose-bisphosphate aldolase [Thermomicrobiales bacterium]|nr:class II fructose-bisphosphate aldolase [Thermomicrobiales bacterium]